MEKIQSIEDINRIYWDEHISVCRGCEFANAASCGEDRLPICNKQYKETIQGRKELAMEYIETTLPQVLEQLQKDYAALRVCRANERQYGDQANASQLSGAVTLLEEAIMKIKVVNFEKRQTALW